MNLTAIAQAYVRCVELEDKSKLEAPEIQEDLSNLRADLHALLMNALRDAHISFSDRFDAARIAHAIASGMSPLGIR